MKTGIIGLPQVGKTSLFRHSDQGESLGTGVLEPSRGTFGRREGPRRPSRPLPRLYNPKNSTHTSVEYVDVGAIGQDALKETAYLAHLRNWTR